MPGHLKIGLPVIGGQVIIPLSAWPEQDRVAWQQRLSAKTGGMSIQDLKAQLDASGSDGRRGRNGRSDIASDPRKANRDRQQRRAYKPCQPEQWTEARRGQMISGYGTWLAFLRQRQVFDVSASPGSRVTPELVVDYINLLRDSCAKATIHTYIERLKYVLLVLAPRHNWGWLENCARQLKPGTPDPTRHLDKIIHPAELLALGEHLREQGELEATKRRARTGKRGAVLFRDGLMLTMFVLCVLRRRSMLSLDTGTRLIKIGGAYTVSLNPGDLKAQQPALIPLPDWLTEHIDRYQSYHRKNLLRDKEISSFWVSDQAKPIQGHSVWSAISIRTTAAFGKAIGPHFIRHCVATTTAIEHPEHIQLLPALLQHKGFRVAERHYLLYNQLRANSEWQDTLEVERRELAMEVSLAAN